MELLGCGARTGLGVTYERGDAANSLDSSGSGGPACLGVPDAVADRAPSAPSILATGTNIDSVAADSGEVYFSDCDDTHHNSRLRVVSGDGRSQRDVAPVCAGRRIGLDSNYIYYGGTEIGRVPRSGGPAVTLLARPIDFTVSDPSSEPALFATHGEVLDGFAGLSRFAVDGSAPYILDVGPVSWGIVERANWVYWAEPATPSPDSTPLQRILRVPASGGAIEVVGRVGGVNNIVADCKSLYVSSAVDVWRLPIDGGSADRIATVGGSLALDSRGLYIQGFKSVWRLSLATLSLTEIGPGSGSPVFSSGSYGIAVDDIAVYWSTGGALLRAMK
jgi:hypothetical protein